jgi:hypothetical protein
LGGIDMDGRILKYILYTGDEEIYMKFWMENLKTTDQLWGIDMDGRIILKYILNKLRVKFRLDSTGSGQIHALAW